MRRIGSRIVFVAALAFAVAGCGAGAIATHARAAQVVSPVLDAARVAIHDARAAELDACTDEPCLDAGEARWAPAVVAYNLVREAYVAWVNGMELAALAGTPDADAWTILLPLGLALVQRYNGVATALEPFELHLPALPDLSVLGGE